MPPVYMRVDNGADCLSGAGCLVSERHSRLRNNGYDISGDRYAVDLRGSQEDRVRMFALILGEHFFHAALFVLKLDEANSR
jgi:hypothetical protein